MIKKLSLFNSKREFFIFLGLLLFISSYSLLIEFHNYKTLTHFDSNLVNATILKQYKKTKLTKTGKIKEYQVLKLKSDRGYMFYTSASGSLEQSVGKYIQLELYAGKISFHEYMSSFYAYSKILSIEESSKQILNQKIASLHTDSNATAIYQALYTATPLNRELQTVFSNLGVSHLFAISGFHLGVLSGVLFFLFKFPYKLLQDRYFPYRNSKRDLFIAVAILLLSYMLFLDTPSSLLRSFALLLIGFTLYDRGFKLVSMQTLLITVLLLMAFFPRLSLELGFWLSVGGVFYIFLFLLHFKAISKIKQFILLPLCIYLMMLPYSLYLFENFSLYHPLSLLWTSLFSLFYPLSILMHLFGLGDFFDTPLKYLVSLGTDQILISLPISWLTLHLFLSFLGLYKKIFLWPLSLLTLFIFIYAVLQL